MKKIIYSLIASLFLLTGCDSFLEEDLKSSLAPENTYTSSHGFEVGVTGLYMYARWEFQTWNDGPIPHGACPYEALQLGTDLAHRGHDEGTLVPFEDYTLTASSSYVKSFWKWAYGMIGSANLLLEYAEGDVKWDTPEDKAFYQAEIRFFRAYAYRYLVYLYGDVPWVDKVEKNFRIDYTRTPKAEVLNNIIEDLKFAESVLPSDPDKLKTEGRLSVWAVKHMMSEVYIMAGEYKEAEQKAKEVIDAPYFSLIDTRFGKETDKPGDYFSDMFKEFNQNRSSGNKETIWAIQLEYNVTGGGAAYADWTKRAWVPKYWRINGFALADSLGGRGLAQIVAYPWVFNLYEQQDVRNSEYNIKRDWYYNNPAVPELYGKKVEATPEQWEKWDAAGELCTVTTKFFYGKTADDEGYNGNNKDRMKFRLAETYLLRAEALIQLGETAEAAKMINAVRERSKATPITASEATIDYLLDERMRELLGEELRRFTLTRTGKLIDRVKKYNPKSADKIQAHHVLWPIPQDVIDANTGAEFPQNGY